MHHSWCGTPICILQSYDPLDCWSVLMYHWPRACRSPIPLQPHTCSHFWMSTLCTNSNDCPKMPHWHVLRRVGVECDSSTILWRERRFILGYFPFLLNLLTRPSLSACITIPSLFATKWSSTCFLHSSLSLYEMIGRFVYSDRHTAFISPTWMNLQIIFNARAAFHEYHVSIFFVNFLIYKCIFL